ncbi:hypothetical protein XHV734_3574 [Xanthomonas hortorum pv. vitians]|nr:hypothetical protein XHV734_3574 [Xanthomonas hortorum pv. vitians]
MTAVAAVVAELSQPRLPAAVPGFAFAGRAGHFGLPCADADTSRADPAAQYPRYRTGASRPSAGAQQCRRARAGAGRLAAEAQARWALSGRATGARADAAGTAAGTRARPG